MPRTRTVPDSHILSLVCREVMRSGEKTVSFASVAELSGLAASTLVQRFGTRNAMLHAALLTGWDRLDLITADAEAQALASPKGAQALLKAIANEPEMNLLLLSLNDAALTSRASQWRATVETALAKRLGTGAKGRDLAVICFAAWQGRILWSPAGGKSFRLADLIRKRD